MKHRHFIVLALSAFIVSACGGGGGGTTSIGPTQAPQGIVVTPGPGTQSAPYQIACGTSQTFTASEAGYNGAFTFNGFSTGSGEAGPGFSLSVPSANMVTIQELVAKPPNGCPVTMSIVVRDSLGNMITFWIS